MPFSFYLTSPPKAGDTLILEGRPALCLSPRPVTSMQGKPLLPPAFILNQNDVYMDIGAGESDFNVAFETRFVLFMVYLFSAMFLGVVAQGPDLGWIGIILPVIPISVLLLVAFSLLIRKTLKRRKVTNVRFNRQRREVCYLPAGSDKPRIIPWESLVAYVYSGTFTGATASGQRFKMDDYGLNLAEYDNTKGEMTCFYQSEKTLIASFAVEMWEVIRRYMEEPAGQWIEPSRPLDTRENFRKARRALWQRFKNNTNRRWFSINPRDYSESYLCMGLYYLFHTVFMWNIPFLVSELYLRFSACRPVPEEVQEWSEPLPSTQWASPSREFLAEREQFLKATAE